MEGGETVIVCELFQSAVPQPIGAAVSRPEHRTGRSAREQRDHGAAAVHGVHGTRGGPYELIVHVSDALPDPLDQILEAGANGDLGERVAHHAAGDLAIVVSAETVGDTPDADVGALDERILVDLAN